MKFEDDFLGNKLSMEHLADLEQLGESILRQKMHKTFFLSLASSKEGFTHLVRTQNFPKN